MSFFFNCNQNVSLQCVWLKLSSIFNYFKTKVIVNAYAIGRDPNYWIEPDSFSRERSIDSSVNFKCTNFKFAFWYDQRWASTCIAALSFCLETETPKCNETSRIGQSVRRKDGLHLSPLASLTKFTYWKFSKGKN